MVPVIVSVRAMKRVKMAGRNNYSMNKYSFIEYRRKQCFRQGAQRHGIALILDSGPFFVYDLVRPLLDQGSDRDTKKGMQALHASKDVTLERSS